MAAATTSTATMTERERLAREKESVLQAALRGREVAATVRTRTAGASPPQRMTDAETEVREREAALLRNLRGLGESPGGGGKAPPERGDRAGSLPERSDEGVDTEPNRVASETTGGISIPYLTPREARARRMAEALERNLQSTRNQNRSIQPTTTNPKSHGDFPSGGGIDKQNTRETTPAEPSPDLTASSTREGGTSGSQSVRTTTSGSNREQIGTVGSKEPQEYSTETSPRGMDKAGTRDTAPSGSNDDGTLPLLTGDSSLDPRRTKNGMPPDSNRSRGGESNRRNETRNQTHRPPEPARDREEIRNDRGSKRVKKDEGNDRRSNETEHNQRESDESESEWDGSLPKEIVVHHESSPPRVGKPNSPPSGSKPGHPIEGFREGSSKLGSLPDAAPMVTETNLRSMKNRRQPGARESGSDQGSLSNRQDEGRNAFPSAAGLFSEDSDEEEARATALEIDTAGIERSETLARASKREGRRTNRRMVVIFVLLGLAFLIILFVILDPLRRLITE